MKRSILAGSLLIVTLVQSLSHAQMVDLPDPGGETGGNTQVTPSNPTPQTPSQFAGLLRMGSLSRKSGGTLYKIDFAPAARLQRLDVRVSANRLKIYSTSLVTSSGNKISIQQLSNTAVIATNSVVNSENISLNENVSSVEMLMESYDGEAEVILTAVASSDVPKMTLRQEVKPQPQEPIVVDPTPDVTPNNPYEPLEPYNPDDGSIVYYGNKFRQGDRVLYRQREVGTVSYVYRRSVTVFFDEGYELEVAPNELKRSAQCIGGFCAGERIVYGAYQGRIITLFENQLADVELEGNFSYESRRMLVSTQVLRKPTPNNGQQRLECTRDRRFCLGDRAQYDGYVVTIEAIYSNGTAVVVDAAGSQTVRIRDLREVPRRRW